jgi:hypothetical protein
MPFSPCRNDHGKSLVPFHPPAAAALRTRLVDDDAAAMARRTGADLPDQYTAVLFPAGLASLPRALAALAGSRRSPFRGAAACAGGTGGGAANSDSFLASRKYALQGYSEAYLQVCPARWAARPAEEAVEQPASEVEAEVEAAKQVPEIDPSEKILRRVACHPCKTASIVLRSFPRIGKHGVGLSDLLETLLRSGLLVTVGVIAQRQFAEGILDGLLVGAVGKAQDFVVVALLIACKGHDCLL